MKVNNLKRIPLIITIIMMIISIGGCQTNASSTITPIYRTPEEWIERYNVEEYKENVKLDSLPSNRPSAKCVNGTFVGNNIDGIDIYKGIPYAKAPVGELRFQIAQPVTESNDIYDASYYGKSFMQPTSQNEKASLYETGEDCLYLNVWNNTKDSSESKPVFVYIHGGGFLFGGTSDPLYDAYNFAYYNPEVIVVTLTYRAGLFGFLNLSELEDGDDYKYSTNNGLYDQIEALRWIKNNISNFGGDSNNITICGESAGGCFVSILCVMDEAKGLFNKAIPMSGAINLCTSSDSESVLTNELCNYFNAYTVKDLQKIPYEDIYKWWEANYATISNAPTIDNVTLKDNLFDRYRSGYTKDLTILQGHTKNEFRYYYLEFNQYKPMYLAICDEETNAYAGKSTGNFDELYERYKQAIMNLGYPEEEVNMCFADDVTLSMFNTFQAVEHAKNGGKSYSYTFDIPYDAQCEGFDLGAAHACDCFYLFGNFNGEGMIGTNEQVDASIKFQKMIANFCKTGDPSIDNIAWPAYDAEHRNKMIFTLSEFKAVENPEKERVDVLLEMIDQFDPAYNTGLSILINNVFTNKPDIYNGYSASLVNN